MPAMGSVRTKPVNEVRRLWYCLCCSRGTPRRLKQKAYPLSGASRFVNGQDNFYRLTALLTFHQAWQ